MLVARSDTNHYITGEPFGSALIFTHKKKQSRPQKESYSQAFLGANRARIHEYKQAEWEDLLTHRASDRESLTGCCFDHEAHLAGWFTSVTKDTEFKIQFGQMSQTNREPEGEAVIIVMSS